MIRVSCWICHVWIWWKMKVSSFWNIRNKIIFSSGINLTFLRSRYSVNEHLVRYWSELKRYYLPTIEVHDHYSSNSNNGSLNKIQVQLHSMYRHYRDSRRTRYSSLIRFKSHQVKPTLSSLKSFELSMEMCTCTQAPCKFFAPCLNIGKITLIRCGFRFRWHRGLKSTKIEPTNLSVEDPSDCV